MSSESEVIRFTMQTHLCWPCWCVECCCLGLLILIMGQWLCEDDWGMRGRWLGWLRMEETDTSENNSSVELSGKMRRLHTWLSHCCVQIPGKRRLKEGRAMLVYGLRGCSTWWRRKYYCGLHETLCVCSQEATRDEFWCLVSFFFYSSWSPAHVKGPLRFRGLPFLVKSFWKQPHRHTQRHISWEF